MSLFVKLSTSIISDEKIIAAGPDGFALWAKGLAWSMEHLTDGFVPSTVLPLLGIGVADPESVAERLCSVGLWVACDGGWTVGKDRWGKWQTTSEQVEEKRESGRKRISEWRNKRRTEQKQDGNEDETQVKRGSNAVTNADVTQTRTQNTEHITQKYNPPTPLNGKQQVAPDGAGVERRTHKQAMRELRDLLPATHQVAALSEAMLVWADHRQKRRCPVYESDTIRRMAEEWRNLSPDLIVKSIIESKDAGYQKLVWAKDRPKLQVAEGGSFKARQVPTEVL